MVTLTSISLNNSIGIITLKDNLVHKYFTDLRWEKDNNTPVGYARAKMPYNKEILKYWSKYDGIIVIHAQLSKNKIDNQAINNLPNTSLKTKSISKIKTEKKDNKIKITNKEYNYSFIGHIHTVKQKGQNIIIDFTDLGWKFMQKVPMDFRKAYIAGQTLDIAFQAICEFIGVQFAYSIEKLSEYNFSIDGYSIEKDGIVIETVPDMLSEYKKEELNEEEGNDENNVLQDKILSSNFKKVEDPKTYEEKQLSKMQQKNQNQISKLSKTNMDNNEEKDMQQEEFDDKIRDLFIGNTIYDSNITDAILNYDAITVEPKAVSSSEISETGTPGASNNENNQNNNNNSSSNFDWAQMSTVVRRYFNRNNPNINTIVQTFRGCGDNWDCLASNCNRYRQYRSSSNIDQIVRELRACFK